MPRKQVSFRCLSTWRDPPLAASCASPASCLPRVVSTRSCTPNNLSKTPLRVSVSAAEAAAKTAGLMAVSAAEAETVSSMAAKRQLRHSSASCCMGSPAVPAAPHSRSHRLASGLLESQHPSHDLGDKRDETLLFLRTVFTLEDLFRLTCLRSWPPRKLGIGLAQGVHLREDNKRREPQTHSAPRLARKAALSAFPQQQRVRQGLRLTKRTGDTASVVFESSLKKSLSATASLRLTPSGPEREAAVLPLAMEGATARRSTDRNSVTGLRNWRTAAK